MSGQNAKAVLLASLVSLSGASCGGADICSGTVEDIAGTYELDTGEGGEFSNSRITITATATRIQQIRSDGSGEVLPCTTSGENLCALEITCTDPTRGNRPTIRLLWSVEDGR